MGTEIGDQVEEGGEYTFMVSAKGVKGEGIGKIGNLVVFIKNAKTRIGNNYKIRVTKMYNTFAYAELSEDKHAFLGNGSVLEL